MQCKQCMVLMYFKVDDLFFAAHGVRYDDVYRTLATNSERVLSALWGKLAAEILMQQWETALDDLTKLKEIIDANTFAPILQQLQQRVWLMHWALFVFFEHENGRNAIIDLFFQDRCDSCPRSCLGCHAGLPLASGIHG